MEKTIRRKIMNINLKDAAIGVAVGAGAVIVGETLFWVGKKIFKKKGGEKPQPTKK